MKFEFIKSHKSEHTIVKMCKVMEVSTSGFYAWQKREERGETEREKFNRFLDERIQHHFADNLGIYGSPRIHYKITQDDGLCVSEKKVANRMRELGLFATPPKRYINTTDSTHKQRVYPNELDRSFTPENPNDAWVTDITYIHTGEGFIYLNPVLDLYSKKVISYTIEDRMDQSLSLKALRQALALRKPPKGWIHHSDRGSQYCSNQYVKELEQAGATISMSRKGNPYDNACAESFFASLKKEYLHRFVFPTKEEAIGAIEFYIEFYNRKRIHSTIGYLTPMEQESVYKAYKAANSSYVDKGENSTA